MKQLVISIANVALRLECFDETFLDELARERYESFIVSGVEHPHIRILLHPKSSPPTRIRMESAKVRQAEGGWRFVYDSFVADVTAEMESAEVVCLRSAYAVDSFLRTLLALYLPRYNGMLLHAAAVRDEQKGYVFAGRSGAGKSTIARLLAGRTEILTDELVALCRAPDGWCAFGTPFWGDFAQAGANLSAPLHALYLLAHAQRNHVERLSRRDALLAVLQCSLQFAEGAQVAEWMLNAVSLLVREVPIHRLHFLPDASFWQLVSDSG